MNDIVKASSGALSTDIASKLLKGISESRAQTPKAGGSDLLRMLKHGEWVYGQEDTEVQEGSLWAVNPLSIAHGWACWTDYPASAKKKNDLLGETMAPIYEPLPVRPAAMTGGDGVAYEFKASRSFQLRCMNGEDEGVEVMHKLGSVGGMRAFDGLIAEMQAQLASNPAYPCPVIELEVDSYQHKQWGKTFVPIFTLRGWADMNGNMSDQEELHGEGEQVQIAKETAPEPAQPEPTQRRRRSTVSDANTVAAKPADPAPSAPAEQPVTRSAPAEQPAAPSRTGMPRRRPAAR